MYQRHPQRRLRSGMKPIAANLAPLSSLAMRRTASNRLSGAALIIVLTFLIVITGLVVAFLSSITNEAAATASSTSAVSTRELADSAIQLTIAQIRDATKGIDTNGNIVGWSSQPGLIRTFPTDDTGSNTTLYKLYSSTNMVDTSTTANPTNDLPSNSAWSSNTAQWIDMNAPVVSTIGGVTNYPIMDPSLAMTNPANGVANTNNYVDGFTISPTPGVSNSANAAPMPVQWIYQLKNGTLTVPNSVTGNTATFTSNAPTATNPIVGRIAFWTDDETCKLNINTASEGVPWDPPSYMSLEDFNYQFSLPLGTEYNRIAGHPANVSLSPVLWSYFGFPHPSSLAWATLSSDMNQGGGKYCKYGEKPLTSLPPMLSSMSATNYGYALFGNSSPPVNPILPRSAPFTNGSQSGSFQTFGPNNRLTLRGILPQTARLYSSVDELAFAATNSSPMRAGNSTALTPRTVSQLGFFLTAASRAPEVNMFNLPRICLWPENDTNRANTVNPNFNLANARSTLDQTIAYCSTLGTNAYYFTRFDPSSQTNDFQGRNVTLYNYMVNLLRQPIPGYSNSLSSRWGLNATYETATLCYDYIRSSVNLVDSSGTLATGADAPDPLTRYRWSYTVPPTNTLPALANIDPDAIVPGTGQVLPILIATNGITTRGMGRFPTIKSATMIFCAVAADQPPLMVNTNTRVPDSPATVNPLHPFPGQAINNAANVSTTVTNYWERGSNSITNCNRQYPSFYPTNGGLMTIPPDEPTSWASTNNYVNNLASTVIMNFDTNNTVALCSNATIQAGGFVSFSAAKGVTITHPGLVFGGDINYRTGAFDAYNIYFANVASTLGISTADNFIYTNRYAKSVTTGPPPDFIRSTNFSSTLVTNALTAPNTSSNLFPALYQTVMQPVLVLDQGFVSPGFPPLMPNYKILVTGLNNLTVDGAAAFGGSNYGISYTNRNFTPVTYQNSWAPASPAGPDVGMSVALNCTNGNMTNGVAGVNAYPFVGNFVKTTNTTSPNFGRTFQLGVGTITVTYLKPTANFSSYNGTTAPSSTDTNVIQQISIVFPGATTPTPKLPYCWWGGVYPKTNSPYKSYLPVTDCPIVFSTISTNATNFPAPENLFPTNMIALSAGKDSYRSYFLMWEQLGARPNCFMTAATLRSVEVTYGDWRLPSMMQTVAAPKSLATPLASSQYGYQINDSSSLYTPHLLYFATNDPNIGTTNFFWRAAHTLRGYANPNFNTDAGGHAFPSCSMFVQGLNNAPYSNSWIDPGMIYSVNSRFGGFLPSDSDGWGGTTNNPALRMMHHLGYGNSASFPDTLSTVDQGGGLLFSNSIPSGVAFPNVWMNGGDFDTSLGAIVDGPYVNKPDEGTTTYDTNGSTPRNVTGYQPWHFSQPQWASIGAARFSPYRQIPSAGVFGSLPVGFDPSNPSITNAWRTLQFSPNPNSSNRVTGNPPDFLLMDLFNMPLVEPYPISEPFSTAGRVNLNYQIAPFGYINRDSALRGVLKSVDMAALSDSQAIGYKIGDVADRCLKTPPPNSPTNFYYYHYPIHLNETLKQVAYKFSTNGFFRSGAEICSVWLYPAVAPNATTVGWTNPATSVVTDAAGTNTNIYNWWYGGVGTTRKGVTGDNQRERPYAVIYPQITTKSNTYQIHYRVQTLKQTATAHPSASTWNTWVDPGKGGITDKVVGELRGSAVIERYIDPSNPNLPDFATNVTSSGISGATMDSFYRFRIFNAKQFTP